VADPGDEFEVELHPVAPGRLATPALLAEPVLAQLRATAADTGVRLDAPDRPAGRRSAQLQAAAAVLAAAVGRLGRLAAARTSQGVLVSGRSMGGAGSGGRGRPTRWVPAACPPAGPGSGRPTPGRAGGRPRPAGNPTPCQTSRSSRYAPTRTRIPAGHGTRAR